MMTVRCDMDDVGCFIVRDGTVDFLNGRLFTGRFRFVYGSVRPSDVVGGLGT